MFDRLVVSLGLVLIELLVASRLMSQSAHHDTLQHQIDEADRQARVDASFALRLELYQRLMYEGRIEAADSLLVQARQLAQRQPLWLLNAEAMEMLGLFRKGQVEAAWQQGLRLRKQAYKLRNAQLIAQVGLNLMRVGRKPERLDSLIAIQENDHDWLVQRRYWTEAGLAINHAAILCAERGDFVRGLRNFEKALRIAQRSEDPRAIAKATLNIGIAKRELGDRHQALQEFEAARRLLVACRCDTSMLGYLHYIIGTTQVALGNDSAAYANFHRARLVYQKLRDWGMRHKIIGQLIRYQLKQGQFDSAAYYLTQARQLLPQIPHGDNYGEHELLEAHLALHQQAFDRCRNRAQAAYTLFVQLNNVARQQEATELLYRADSSAGRFQEALRHYQTYHRLRDSLRSETNVRALGRLEARLEAEAQLARERAARERTRWMLGSAAGGLLVLALLALILFRGRQKEKRANALLRRLNHEIIQQKAEIEAQHEEITLINAELQATLQEVSNQRQALEIQHQQIEDSIRYASRIQRAILPDPHLLERALPPHFIHYQPRDIVSGDFYWVAQVNGLSFLAVVDCTGHGVPGAFMSVVGANLLQQLVVHQGYHDPETILTELDRRIVEILHQELGGDTNDGMDLGLLVLYPPADGSQRIDFAGGGRPLWWLRGDEIIEFKSGAHGCGGRQQLNKTFPVRTLQLQANERLYLFSDGVTDQFGGPQGRKLSPNRLREFLIQSRTLSIREQGLVFARFFASWQGKRRQLDDVILAGLAGGGDS